MDDAVAIVEQVRALPELAPDLSLIHIFGNAVANRMNAFENFVMIQSDAALRQVAGQYAYDDNEADTCLLYTSRCV